jgi:thiamine biosynthesis protein ThiS
MALVVNGESHPFGQGLTVKQLLMEKQFSFPLKTVFVNGHKISKSDYGDRKLSDGDRVDVIHLMSGG